MTKMTSTRRIAEVFQVAMIGGPRLTLIFNLIAPSAQLVLENYLPLANHIQFA